MAVAEYAKALVGGVVSSLTALGVSLADGVVTPVEWIAVVLAFIAGSGFVYAVPNSTALVTTPVVPPVVPPAPPVV
jgi:hypothetical protein